MFYRPRPDKCVVYIISVCVCKSNQYKWPEANPNSCRDNNNNHFRSHGPDQTSHSHNTCIQIARTTEKCISNNIIQTSVWNSPTARLSEWMSVTNNVVRHIIVASSHNTWAHLDGLKIRCQPIIIDFDWRPENDRENRRVIGRGRTMA